MKKSEVKNLNHGLYQIYWKDGGSSLASVGSDESGNRWYSPTNWITVPSFNWKNIKSVRSIVESGRHINLEVAYDDED